MLKPEDLAGLKIRVPESPVWVEMIRAMGAAPTPIPFGEVYTALQQKTVDGQENPIPTIYSRKFYEVQGASVDDAAHAAEQHDDHQQGVARRS